MIKKVLCSFRMVLLTTLLLCISGCYVFGVGEAVVRFAGTINYGSFGSYSCELVLLSGETKLDSFKIEGSFRVSYTIEPISRDYMVKVVCVDGLGKRLELKRDEVKLGGKPLIEIDLGHMNIDN